MTDYSDFVSELRGQYGYVPWGWLDGTDDSDPLTAAYARIRKATHAAFDRMMLEGPPAPGIVDVCKMYRPDLYESSVPMDTENQFPRFSVGLLPKVATELDQLTRDSGMSKTDVINRAVAIYAYITGRIAAGDHILVRDGETKEVERLHLI